MNFDLDFGRIQKSMDVVPKWAYQWCTLFAVIAAVSIITGFLGILYGSRQSMGIMVVYIISTILQAGTAMTLYWMCRNSLRKSE
jgi:hypothetical protein